MSTAIVPYAKPIEFDLGTGARISLRELRDAMTKHHQRCNSSFEVVLRAVHAKIKQAASRGRERVEYMLTEFVPGLPIMHLPQLTEYIIANLKGNGLDAAYLFPNILAVSWRAACFERPRERIQAHNHEEADRSIMRSPQDHVDNNVLLQYKPSGKKIISLF
jgi:hypothetical protein